MTTLDSWLKQATQHLSKDSVAQVQTEIRRHYESAQESALASGASAAEADRVALAALGDAKLANRQYRKVLLTSTEARMLCGGKWEAHAICSRPWLSRSLAAASPVSLLAAAAAFFAGVSLLASALLVVGMGTGILFAAPRLPVYIPVRARVFRCVKWLLLTLSLILAFGPDALKWSWLLASCLWPMAWVEWTRFSIRRKLPVARWPRQLYL